MKACRAIRLGRGAKANCGGLPKPFVVWGTKGTRGGCGALGRRRGSGRSRDSQCAVLHPDTNTHRMNRSGHQAISGVDFDLKLSPINGIQHSSVLGSASVPPSYIRFAPFNLQGPHPHTECRTLVGHDTHGSTPTMSMYLAVAALS